MMKNLGNNSKVHSKFIQLNVLLFIGSQKTKFGYCGLITMNFKLILSHVVFKA